MRQRRHDNLVEAMRPSFVCLLLCALVPGIATAGRLEGPPLRAVRAAFTFDWCDCGRGKENLTLWPANNVHEKVEIIAGKGPSWFDFGDTVKTINWICSGMTDVQESSLSRPSRYWSAQLSSANKPFPCENSAGRAHFVGWDQAPYLTGIPYSSGENGYTCIKIPVLVRTQNRTLLAIAEARKFTCSDFAWTDLVIKSSHDNGLTWSAMRVIRTESGPGLPHTVIGNAAPVQLARTGRILLPHTRNNSDVWITHSDDDGETWSEPVEIKNGTRPGWKWVGTGPPASIQLRSGRIIVPSYHSIYRGNLINNIVHGHVMLSDDEGYSWRIGGTMEKKGDAMVNECQAVELKNGSVLINARSFATLTTEQRIQTLSNDGGLSFGPTSFVPSLPQPFDGCEGSTVQTSTGILFFTGPDSHVKRDHMTLWRSEDEGTSWKKQLLLDPGASGYSALVVVDPESDSLGLLYEQSDQDELIMAPDRFVYRAIPQPKKQEGTLDLINVSNI